MYIHLEYSPHGGITEVVASALSKISDPILHGDILDEAMTILLHRVRSRFLREVDPDEVPWIPSQAGLRRKSGKYTYRNGRKYTGTGTLFETGDLFHSIQAIRGSAPFERGIKTDVPYGLKHQLGLEGMETREFLGFSTADLLLFEKLVVKRVQEAVYG